MNDQNRRMASALAALLWLVALSGGAWGCAEDGAHRPSADPDREQPDAGSKLPDDDTHPEPGDSVVRALWDPVASELPSPTDLLRDKTSGRLALPASSGEQSEAERQWRAWLNTLDGYPVGSTLRLPLDGALRADAELASELVVVAMESAAWREPMSARFEPEHNAILARPVDFDGSTRELAPGVTYAWGLRGYEQGPRGLNGEQVVASEPFASLRDGADAGARINALRPMFSPVFELLSGEGLEREQIAVAGSLTTSDRPTILFDVESGALPMPNDLLFDRDTGQVSLPARLKDSAARRHLKALLSEYDGFSTTGAITITASAPLDLATALDPASARLFKLDAASDQLEEVTDLERGVLEDGVTLWLRPRLALEPASRYLYLVTERLKSAPDQARFEKAPTAAILTFSATLTEAQTGKSTLEVLSAEQARALEPTRAETSQLLDLLDLEREAIAVAVPFRTLDAVGHVMALRNLPYEQSAPADVDDVVIATPRARGVSLAMPHVETIVTGAITTLDTLDPVTLKRREGGGFKARPVPFTLTIPQGAERYGEALPVVVFGHGLLTSRELLYLVAEPLARAGYAAISIDLPLHGERSVCLVDTDCKGQGARCVESRRCELPDGTPASLQRFNSPFQGGPSYPVTSGMPFILVEDIEASRDHFEQAIVDLSQLLRVVRRADWQQITDGYRLDGEDVMYLGMSLGGILGALLTVIEPAITTYVLNVPGAGLMETLEHSAAFTTVFNDELRAQGIAARQGDAYFAFTNAVRWVLDVVDPINVVQHAVRRPTPLFDAATGQQVTPAPKRVQVQMAVRDSVVPNVATELLAERLGVEARRYTPTISNHAFLFDPTSIEGERARRDMIEFFEERSD